MTHPFVLRLQLKQAELATELAFQAYMINPNDETENAYIDSVQRETEIGLELASQGLDY